LRSEESRKLENLYDGEMFVANEVRRAKEQSQRIDTAFFENIASKILNILDERKKKTHRLEAFEARFRGRERTLAEVAQFAAFLSRIYFDAELFIMSESDLDAG